MSMQNSLKLELNFTYDKIYTYGEITPQSCKALITTVPAVIRSKTVSSVTNGLQQNSVAMSLTHCRLHIMYGMNNSVIR